jgi:hypothetical protein
MILESRDLDAFPKDVKEMGFKAKDEVLSIY